MIVNYISGQKEEKETAVGMDDLFAKIGNFSHFGKSLLGVYKYITFD